MKGKLIAITAAAPLLLAAAPATAKKPWPDTIPLPTGYQPEGIASGKGHTFYVGSIPTGDVRVGSFKKGTTRPLVDAPEGRRAIGLKADNKRRLFVAGGDTGDAYVYNARTGAPRAAFQLAPAAGPTFVNDVTLAKKTAYFTDSQRPVIYAVERDLGGFREIPLVGFTMAEGFNLNGIAATRNGKTLIAVQSNRGALWRIDPKNGQAAEIALTGGSGDVARGDGLLLRGKTLYVVQNQLNQVAVVRLNDDYTGGEITRALTDPDFAVPTTIARQGKRLWAVNARFGIEDPQDASFDVVKVDGR